MKYACTILQLTGVLESANSKMSKTQVGLNRSCKGRQKQSQALLSLFAKIEKLTTVLAVPSASAKKQLNTQLNNCNKSATYMKINLDC